MVEYSEQNKKAWECSAYDFWVREAGIPPERAKIILTDPALPGEFTLIGEKPEATP